MDCVWIRGFWFSWFRRPARKEAGWVLKQVWRPEYLGMGQTRIPGGPRIWAYFQVSSINHPIIGVPNDLTQARAHFALDGKLAAMWNPCLGVLNMYFTPCNFICKSDDWWLSCSSSLPFHPASLVSFQWDLQPEVLQATCMLKVSMPQRSCSKFIVFLTSWLVCLWIASPLFTGKWPRPKHLTEGAKSHLACRVIGGIDGESFENEGCMMRELKRRAVEQEEVAQMAGLALSPQLQKLQTSNDFVKFADKHGADVTKKSTAYWRVSKDNVWWVLSTSKQRFRHKDVKNLIITAFKAMGIAFANK